MMFKVLFWCPFLPQTDNKNNNHHECDDRKFSTKMSGGGLFSKSSNKKAEKETADLAALVKSRLVNLGMKASDYGKSRSLLCEVTAVSLQGWASLCSEECSTVWFSNISRSYLLIWNVGDWCILLEWRWEFSFDFNVPMCQIP